MTAARLGDRRVSTRAPGASPIRIARNDPTLAHALSAAEIERLQRESAKVFARIMAGSMRVAEVSKLLKAHFGRLVIDEMITRPYGSRAKAQRLIVAPELAPAAHPDLGIILATVDRIGFRTRRLPVALSGHVVARLYQRTLGRGGVRNVAVLNHHILEGLRLILENSVEVGADLATATGEGALLWDAASDPASGRARLVAKTWVTADIAADPALKRAMLAASDTEVTVKITSHPGLREPGRRGQSRLNVPRDRACRVRCSLRSP